MENLIGKKFNKLTVLSFSHRNNSHTYYTCQCECGNQKAIDIYYVKKGIIKSCGCLQHQSLVGQKFGRLTVLKDLPKSKKLCICDCGEETIVSTSHLKDGHTKSCGCLHQEKISTIGGTYKTRLHKIWESMHVRCECEKHGSYETYKDKPICKQWHKKPRGKKQTGFFNFVVWAIKNGYQENLSLDRIDNSKGYSPENCRWATIKEQARNTTKNVWIEYRGQKKILCEWCEELGIPQVKIQHTVKRHNLTYAEAFDRHLYYRYNPHTYTWERITGA